MLWRAGAVVLRNSQDVLTVSASLRRYRHQLRRVTTRASTAVHFYHNKQLDVYASREAHRLSLRQLIFFGRSMNEERLIKSANYVRNELPVRIAHRLREMQGLPYVVVTQEDVARVYELYWSAFDKFRQFPPVTSLAENEKFCETVKRLLAEHRSVIPSLSLGLSLSSPHLPPEKLDSFMNRMLVSRISRRVLADHHIALSESFKAKTSLNVLSKYDEDDNVGIIHRRLDIKSSIDKCVNLLQSEPDDYAFRVGLEDADVEGGSVVRPTVIVDGHLDTKFAYIREHFEYIIFELLKNAMRATSIQHRTATSTGRPNIHATIANGKDDVLVRISDQGGGLLNSAVKFPADLFSFSHVRNTTRLEDWRIGALRTVSSHPQGMRATVAEQVRRWQKQQKNTKDDPERTAGVGKHPRLGIGLPMSNIFATYFGGSLELVSLDGWGTDAYLRLPKLGTRLEGIEV